MCRFLSWTLVLLSLWGFARSLALQGTDESGLTTSKEGLMGEESIQSTTDVLNFFSVLSAVEIVHSLMLEDPHYSIYFVNHWVSLTVIYAFKKMLSWWGWSNFSPHLVILSVALRSQKCKYRPSTPYVMCRKEQFEDYDSEVQNKSMGIGIVQGFVASSTVIIVSEIADKTFFIAAIMAMKHSRLAVFIGAIFALALMSVLSVVFGWAATIIPRIYTYYISTVLFVFFGLKMLVEGYKMSPNGGQEEFDEVQSDLRRRDEEIEAEEKLKAVDKITVKKEPIVAAGVVNESEKEVLAPGLGLSVEKVKKKVSCLKVSRIVAQAFTLTFLAEWGDRSQLATIILATREDVYGVTFGSIFGHSICTGLAVLSGRYLAEKISVRSVTILGGVVFLIFAITSLLMDPMED